MALRFAVFSVLVVLVLFLVREEISDCGQGFPCFCAVAAPVEHRSRTLLVSALEELKGFRPSDARGGENVVGWELRKVPSGPDPLHHNSNPKKPQTP